MKKLIFLICVMLCMSLGGAAHAEVAKDVSAESAWRSNSSYYKLTMLTDGKYTTKWQSKAKKHPYVAVAAQDGEKLYGVYVCFATMPEAYEIQVMVHSEWVTYAEGNRDYYHVYYPIPEGVRELRVVVTSEGNYNLQLNEMHVFGAGDVPDWVQIWEPTPEKADILFLASHPDDDLIFFGGAIPTYAVEKNASVVTAYLTYSNTTRRSELLNALWSMGIRKYPVIGTFSDSYKTKIADAYKASGGEQKVLNWVEGLYTTYCPEVVVTHDKDGEYGHGQHKMLVDAAERCLDTAAAKGWQVKKLYEHLAGDTILDWDQPLAAFGGMTGEELAERAFTYHVTQQGTKYDVANTGTSEKYSNKRFGLVYTTVGADVAKNDFLENISWTPGVVEPRPTAVPTEEPTEEPTAEPTPETTPVPTPARAASDTAADGHLSATYVADAKAVDARMQEKIADYPITNGNGFIDAGEYIYSDSAEGMWVYISPTLKVVVEKTNNTKDKLVCLEAEIFTDIAAGEKPDTIFYAEDRKTWVDGGLNALENKVVFATNADYYTYRLSGSRPVGCEIRHGEVIRDTRYTKETTYFPNLDTMALYGDGSMTVHHSYELGSEEFLANGAYCTFCFGPILVKDGEINPDMYTRDRNKTSRQPRYGFGMVEPGHYVAILAEGRLKDSRGICMKDLAEKLYARGCTQALNLDGGQTAIMIFMGKQISRIGPYNGSTAARKTNEIFVFGRSEQVGVYEVQ